MICSLLKQKKLLYVGFECVGFQVCTPSITTAIAIICILH
jgi:hypothetical protein